MKKTFYAKHIFFVYRMQQNNYGGFCTCSQGIVQVLVNTIPREHVRFFLGGNL